MSPQKPEKERTTKLQTKSEKQKTAILSFFNLQKKNKKKFAAELKDALACSPPNFKQEKSENIRPIPILFNLSEIRVTNYSYHCQ